MLNKDDPMIAKIFAVVVVLNSIMRVITVLGVLNAGHRPYCCEHEQRTIF